MPTKYVECDADLDIFPDIQSDLSHVIIGDIHGNAQYLLYLLIKFGVVELSSRQYNCLIKIYSKKTDELTASQLRTFQSILKKAKYNPNVSLLFITGISSGLFYVFWFWGCKQVKGSVAGLFTAFMPVTTLLVAWFALGESITVLQTLGMILVMASVVFNAKRGA